MADDPSDVDVAWCAGVFEGRGSFGTFYENGSKRFQMYINAGKDVVDRFHAIMGGHVQMEAQERFSNQRWKWWNADDPDRVMRLFWPYLSQFHIDRALMSGFKSEGEDNDTE